MESKNHAPLNRCRTSHNYSNLISHGKAADLPNSSTIHEFSRSTCIIL
ncbi:hypothetical protein NC652_021500 [Populus alba x Populus x berolinensis]|nr:hypothetical protein NC652_021500 [Populus alba x Populus x berolinensis]